MADHKKHLLAAIVKYLQNDSTVDQESISVATQVILDAYSLNAEDSSLQLPSNVNLQSVFNAGVEKLNIKFEESLESDPRFQSFISQLEKMGYFKETANETREQKMEKAKQKFLAKTAENPTVLAEKAKDEGNQFMKEKKYKDAIESYKKAIGFNPRNAIYPSNMAAAYINLGDYDNGIKCCKKAVEIDPTFHKAYARLGAVYDRQGQVEEAVAQYKLALQHSPGNKEYETKISSLERELTQATLPQQGGGNPFANLGGMFGGGQGGGMPDMSQLLGGLGGGQGGAPDIGSLLGNPQFMNMAMNMMQQPGMQEMMQGMMQNMGLGSGMMGGQGPTEEQHQAAMDKILQDPEVQENPRLFEIFTKAREGGPQSMLEYVNDPEVSQFMMKYAQKHVDMSQLQNMFGNAFGGGSRDDRDDDSNGGMYS